MTIGNQLQLCNSDLR